MKLQALSVLAVLLVLSAWGEARTGLLVYEVQTSPTECYTHGLFIVYGESRFWGVAKRSSQGPFPGSLVAMYVDKLKACFARGCCQDSFYNGFEQSNDTIRCCGKKWHHIRINYIPTWVIKYLKLFGGNIEPNGLPKWSKIPGENICIAIVNIKAGKHNIRRLSCTGNSRAFLPIGKPIVPSKVIECAKSNLSSDCGFKKVTNSFKALKNKDRRRYYKRCFPTMVPSDSCKVPPVLMFKKKFDFRRDLVNHSQHDYDLASVPWRALLLAQSQMNECGVLVRKPILLFI